MCAKETYVYVKETYIHVKKDLQIFQKEPMYASNSSSWKSLCMCTQEIYVYTRNLCVCQTALKQVLLEVFICACKRDLHIRKRDLHTHQKRTTKNVKRNLCLRQTATPESPKIYLCAKETYIHVKREQQKMSKKPMFTSNSNSWKSWNIFVRKRDVFVCKRDLCVCQIEPCRSMGFWKSRMCVQKRPTYM